MAFPSLFHRQAPVQTQLYRNIALTFFGLSVVIALAVFYISFSWATIRLTPEVTPFSLKARIPVQPQVIEESGAVFGKVIQRELEGTGTFTPTASESKPGRVSGVITAVNKTGRAQALRQTTRFLTSTNILFRSTQSVTVPAGGQVDVPVIADVEGDLGAFDTTFFRIPGLWEPLQDTIYGAAFTQKAGGVQEVRTITAEDVSKAEAEVVKKLEEKFALLLDTEKPSLNSAAVGALFRSDIVERTTNHAVGESVDDFTVRLKLRFTAALFDEQQFIARLEELGASQVSSGYEQLPIKPGEYSGSLEAFDPATGAATVTASVSAAKIRTEDLQPYHASDLAGLDKESIIAYFRGYEDIKDVSVSLYPFWVTRAPLLIDHIKIQVLKDQ